MTAPLTVILFGATGDLARRKLIPGLLHLFLSGLVDDLRVVGTSLDEMSVDEFRDVATGAVREFSVRDSDEAALRDFAQHLDYVPGSASRYRQSGYAVAEMILEDRLGATWPDLVEAHLTGPAGVSETVHAHLASGERSSPLLTSAGWYRTTAADMADVFRALNADRVVDRAFLEALLTREDYVHDGYSLGSILETVDGVRTVGHRGGGARAQIRYVPSRQVGVAVFTDGQDTGEVTIHVADLLVRALLDGAPPQ